MTEQAQQEEYVDYSAQLETRRRNFVQRLSGALAGGVVGVLVGAKKLHSSLRRYLHDRLHTRDWTNGMLERVFDDLRQGNANTISGANVLGGVVSSGGTLIGDPKANAAYIDLIKNNPGLVNKVTEDFGKELDKLRKYQRGLLQKMEDKYFNTDKDACYGELEKLRKLLLEKDGSQLHQQAVNALVETNKTSKMFKGGVQDAVDEYLKIHSNFFHYSNEAKKKLVDGPMFEEMIKRGTAPGNMGLGFRHAHDKGEILAFGAVAAVAVGYVTHEIAKRILGRNDNKPKPKESFRTDVMNQRNSAQNSAAIGQ